MTHERLMVVIDLIVAAALIALVAVALVKPAHSISPEMEATHVHDR